jgi:hypothetical protein
MKRLTVIGKDTAGALSVIHFLRYTDWFIDWYYDSSIQLQDAGEGSLPGLPLSLYTCLDFNTLDLKSIDGTLKTGIYKENWGVKGTSFFHHFTPGQVGYHINNAKLHNFIFEQLKHNPRVRLIDKKVKDYGDIDSDFILDCSNRLSDLSKYYKAKFIPVNSVYVTQCFWDKPEFDYTINNATDHGWYFGIPLQNKCSIGYVYNNNITTLDVVKQSTDKVLNDNKLISSDQNNLFSFDNYFHKNNFSERIVYNGNASFFLEPLEATSYKTMDMIQRAAFDMWHGHTTPEQASNNYLNYINETQIMIMLHYFAGSKFKTPFWEFAKTQGETCLHNAIKTLKLKQILTLSYQEEYYYSTWSPFSFHHNIQGLGLKNIIIDLLSSTEE